MTTATLSVELALGVTIEELVALATNPRQGEPEDWGGDPDLLAVLEDQDLSSENAREIAGEYLEYLTWLLREYATFGHRQLKLFSVGDWGLDCHRNLDAGEPALFDPSNLSPAEKLVFAVLEAAGLKPIIAWTWDRDWHPDRDSYQRENTEFMVDKRMHGGNYLLSVSW